MWKATDAGFLAGLEIVSLGPDREKNGAPSFEQMLEDIEKYRPRDGPRQRDYPIGCIILPDLERLPTQRP